MRFRGLDLNLLIALDVLLAERNVSAAGRRLCLSQSATSGALARLREHFQDDLLLQVGRGMVLTAFAQALIEPLHGLILQIEATVGSPHAFDPATSRRRFKIAASDYIVEVMLSRVIEAAATAAPGLVFDIVLPGADQIASLQAADLDLLILPDLYLSPKHPIEILFEETYVVVAWAENKTIGDGVLTPDVFASLGEVVTRLAANRFPSFAETHRAERSDERRIEVIAPAFNLLPSLVVGTERVAIMQRRLAMIHARYMPLRIHPLPLDLPIMREALQYHQVRALDAGLIWLRALIHHQIDIHRADN